MKGLWFCLFVACSVAPAWAVKHPVPLEKGVKDEQCVGCHDSDDNRELGGNGATGPHGSKFAHILERRYEFNQAAIAGQTVSNLMPQPDLGPTGPYALCAKCHDLVQVTADSSFRQHSRHVNAGFSCSVCHTGHGVGRGASGADRLVSFDLRIVAGVNSAPPAYNRQTQTCALTCHGHTHAAQ
jgi:Doubled CXXCH motif (Paired_CXXCH_1)